MPEQPGSQCLILGGGLAISSGRVPQNSDVVLYSSDVGRGVSSLSKGQEALLFQEGKAQTGPQKTPVPFIVENCEPGKTAKTMRGVQPDTSGHENEGGGFVGIPQGD